MAGEETCDSDLIGIKHSPNLMCSLFLREYNFHLLVSFPQELPILEFLTTSNIAREIGRTSVGFLRLSKTIVLVTHSNC